MEVGPPEAAGQLWPPQGQGPISAVPTSLENTATCSFTLLKATHVRGRNVKAHITQAEPEATMPLLGPGPGPMGSGGVGLHARRGFHNHTHRCPWHAQVAQLPPSRANG